MNSLFIRAACPNNVVEATKKLTRKKIDFENEMLCVMLNSDIP
jgi:hypothetical protein